MSRGDRLFLFAALATIALSIAGTERGPVPSAAPMARERHSVPPPGRRPEPGHQADSPAQIPARGWWNILRRAIADFSNKRLMTEAAGITFYALLALFPALAAMVSLYGLFADPNTIASQVDALNGVIPGGGMQIIGDQLHALASNSIQALGFGAFVGIATSLWSANQGIKGLFDSLNIVYEEHEKRGYIARTALSLAFTLGTVVFVSLLVTAVVALPVALSFVGLGKTSDVLIRLLRWPLLLVVVTVFLAFVYRFGPSREPARWRWVSWGGAFAAIAWVLVSAGFSWYVANFGSYNRTYGSLGAVVGFMTWIWISAMVVLVGAELDAEMEYQTARDTTTGEPRPMGTRGARMADTMATEAA